MRGTRIAFAIFLALSAFVVVGVAVAPMLAAAYPGDPSRHAVSVEIAVAGLAWIFALWGALVAIMLFLVLWVGRSLASEDETLSARRQQEAGYRVENFSVAGTQGGRSVSSGRTAA